MCKKLFTLITLCWVVSSVLWADSLAIPQQEFEKSLKEHVRYNPDGPNAIGYIAIKGKNMSISQATWLYVKKALEYYKEKKPAFIILELDTPGGELYPAELISKALKDIDVDSEIPIVAYINNWAMSAGALLAYSCRYIATSKDGSMGAAEPVVTSGEGLQSEAASEKINSAVRADFGNAAAFFGRNADIAEAMVDKDIVLVVRDGKIVRFSSDDAIKFEGPNPDEVITVKGKLLTLNAQHMVGYGVANMVVDPLKTVAITSQEHTKGSWPADKMALFHHPFFRDIPGAVIDAYQMDWKTRFFALLVTPWVSSMLFLGLLVGAYLEFNTPGFGIAGSIAMTCLLLIILANLSLEIAGWLEVILILSGLAFILLELLFLPTAGVLGAIGALLFLGGVLALMLPGIGNVDYEFDSQTLNAAGDFVFNRLAWLCASFILALIVMAAIGRYLPTSKRFTPLILQGGEQEHSAGYYAPDAADSLPKKGERGVAATSLRPSGKVIINDKLYEAITNGSFIEKDTLVVVEDVDSGALVVSKERMG